MGALSGVLDIPGWFKSDAQTAKDSIPDYVKQIGTEGLQTAHTVNDLALSGYNGPSGLVGPNGMSVPKMFAQNIEQGFNQLDPRNNSQMFQANIAANDAINGGLAARAGGTAANDAQSAAMGAAGNIAGAGVGARGATVGALQGQQAQTGQYGQDLGIIRNSALGQGPSAAAVLAKQQLDASVQAQAAQAAQARGGNVAAGMRSAANAGTQIQLQGAQQMAAQRAQEQLNAQSLLNQGNQGLAGAMNQNTTQAQGLRAQDIGQTTAQAGATNDAAKLAAANYGIGATVAGQGLSAYQNLSGQYAGQMQAETQAQQNAQQQYAQWLQNEYSISSGLPAGQFGGYAAIANQSAQSATQQQSAGLGALGTYIAAA